MTCSDNVFLLYKCSYSMFRGSVLMISSYSIFFEYVLIMCSCVLTYIPGRSIVLCVFQLDPSMKWTFQSLKEG
jgi:hypothetical protein